ncbi:uncharacterized protein LOC134821884 isoform X5 [Bolinopsis microptera]|uniref:uncharacterized protein LOC134821884 isoform X5 n=1 Tax=Bolinopsis microptera TaxID=2820187 RepID=UPI00307AC902
MDHKNGVSETIVLIPDSKRQFDFSFQLQTAISLFKDVLKDSQGPQRLPITDIPPQLENQDDPYALFRYLEQCALDQGAVLTMAPYCTVEVEDDKFNALVESHDLALMDYHGQTVLHITTQYCDKKEVEKLINCGGDPNAEDFDGYTPLFYAAIAQKPNTADTLIKNNADINYRCKKTGRSAMHIAAQFGAMKVMELLVEKGADINVLDNMNHTPIIVSSYYARSDISAYLVDKGADTCIEDKSGIMGLMRIAYTMPTITREVFDKFVTEDVYQGERYYQLDRLVGSPGRNMFCSFYHYLVWLANMGLIEHSIFDRLTKAKWQLYAKKHATHKFIFLGVFLSVWSFVYVQPHSFIDELKTVDVVYALSIIIAMSAYVWRFISNVRLLKEKFKYLNFLKKLFDDTYQREVNSLHFKGKDLENFLKKRYGDRQLTFLDDVKSSPAVLIDFLVDNLLLFFIIGKVIIFVRGAKRVKEPRMNSANDELDASVQLFINATDLFGAIVMILMWLSCFLKLQITKKVGPFVVYMKYVMGDLSTIGTMFATLFVPAVCVFYKTTYSNGLSDEFEGETDSRDPRTFYETIFVVLRMVLIDYEYLDGLDRSIYPEWWMFLSVIWIYLSCVVVLNLLIALMADSYSRIFEKAELFARIDRARFIIEFERTLSKEVMEGYESQMRDEYAPEIVKFDPVTDRDKIDIVEEQVAQLSDKIDRLENLIEKSIVVELQKKLEAIDQALTLYNY